MIIVACLRPGRAEFATQHCGVEIEAAPLDLQATDLVLDQPAVQHLAAIGKLVVHGVRGGERRGLQPVRGQVRDMGVEQAGTQLQPDVGDGPGPDHRPVRLIEVVAEVPDRQRSLSRRRHALRRRVVGGPDHGRAYAGRGCQALPTIPPRPPLPRD